MENYESFISILKEELVPAMGCTEPIALSYAGSIAANELGEAVTKLIIRCSGNIIKNVKSVKVPNTGGLVGIEAAVVAGIVSAKPKLKMEVISELNDEDRKRIREILNKEICTVESLDTKIPLHILIEAFSDNHSVSVEITHEHTHVANVVKDGVVVMEDGVTFSKAGLTDRSFLTVKKIKEFADTCNLDDVKDLIERQIRYNMAIAEEGLTGKYGVGIGKAILKENHSVESKMVAYASSASEARMEGCALPVVTNSGSGNQGITSSVPIIVYCEENKVDTEKMMRALVFSNLMTIHQKTGIGRLSCFCGAICAATSAGSAITYLKGGSLEAIENTVRNNYASVSGIICDGAKASCAFKIYSALKSALLSSNLALNNLSYSNGAGILKKNADETIRSIGILGSQGMKETDHVVLSIMLDE